MPPNALKKVLKDRKEVQKKQKTEKVPVVHKKSVPLAKKEKKELKDTGKITMSKEDLMELRELIRNEEIQKL